MSLISRSRRLIATAAIAASLPALAIAGAGEAAAGPATADSRVATVYDARTDYYATGFGATKELAIADARRNVGNSRAEMLVWRERGCVAVAANRTRVGWAHAASKGWALQSAANNAGADARTITWGCSAGHQAAY